MRDISSSLAAFLTSRVPYWIADLFTVTLANGSIIYLTSANVPVTNGTGTTWESMPSPMLSRTGWKMTKDFDVPTMTIKLLSTGDDLGTSVNIKSEIHQGLFDGAQWLLSRAYFSAAPVSATNPWLMEYDAVPLFLGTTSTIKGSSRGCDITIKALNVIFQSMVPKNIYSYGCIWNVYSAGCTLNIADYTIDNTVGSGTISKVSIPWGTTPSNPTYYSQGIISFTSGVNEGASRTVISASNTALTLSYPFYNMPAEGDTFTICQGCNQTLARCTQFNNTQNFRGEPYIPPAETAL